MGYELNPGQGSLFRNDRNGAGKFGAPSLKGKLVTPSGEVLYVSAWTKRLSDGTPWLSLRAEAAAEPQEGSRDPVVHSLMSAAAELAAHNNREMEMERKKNAARTAKTPDRTYGWDSLPCVKVSEVQL